MYNNNTSVVLDECLRELHLPTIRKHHKEISKKAIKESFSYEQYLLTLAEDECSVRRGRRIERLLKESKLPLDKNLESFDLKRLPLKASQQINTLLNGKFIDHKENVLIFGNPGSGKTHLLSAIGQELIDRNIRKTYFARCSILVQELLLAKKTLQLPRMLKKLSKFEALIIDDIGYVQQSREEMEVLFTLLAERYERGSILLSSNLPFSKWERIFKDPMVTAAAIDRLIHHSVIIELNIPSYRMSQARDRKKSSKPAKRKGGKKE